MRNERRSPKLPPVRPSSIGRPSIESGASMWNASRIVGATSTIDDEAGTTGDPRYCEAGPDTGRPQGRDRELQRTLRTGRTDHHHRVALRIHRREHVAEEPIEARQHRGEPGASRGGLEPAHRVSRVRSESSTITTVRPVQALRNAAR